MAAGLAIAQAWRGRAGWEPSEEDISRGPQKVGSLAAAVLVAVLWAKTSGSANVTTLAVALIALTIMFLCIYGYVVATQTYTSLHVVQSTVQEEKIVGGYRLTAAAKKRLQAGDLTVQELFKGAAYDPDKVWTRSSRALAKMTFVLGYLGLTICGTLALAAGAIILGQAIT